MSDSVKAAKQHIRLVMIVKDESHIIERCLNSVKPVISSYCICDTGSTDDTISLIRSTLFDISGEIAEVQWTNFAANRSQAIRLAQKDGVPDYLLFIDADETLIIPDGFEMPQLVTDCYRLELRYGGVSYYRPSIVRASLPWRYECVCHEYLHLDTPFSTEILDGPYILVRCEGSRSKDPLKYQKDAAVIQEALEADLDGPFALRYMYYLAQSHKDAGNKELALRWFKLRASKNGWVEERYMAALWAARIMECLGMDFDLVVLAYLKAWEILPSRTEALGNLCRFSRLHNHFALGSLFARTSAVIAEPKESLFKESCWYQWASLDELAVSSFHIGDARTCYNASCKLLNHDGTPESEKPRIETNMKFAAERLGFTSASVQPDSQPLPPPQP